MTHRCVNLPAFNLRMILPIIKIVSIIKIMPIVMILLAVSACSQPAGTPVPTPQASAEALASPVAVASPAPTSLPEANRVLLLTPEGVDPAAALPVQDVLRELAEKEGLLFETISAFENVDLAPDIRMVFLLPPDPGAANLAAANPDVQFAAIGIPGMEPASNLSLVSAQDSRPDQSGFLAGYLAAVITSDWRVGVIGRAETPASKAARQGFIHGVIFYCGLCRPAYPPFVQYPIDVSLPAGAGQAEQQAAVDQLTTNAVQTVFVSPELNEPLLLEALSQAGMKLIGSSAPPDALKSQYVASIQFDQAGAVRSLWTGLMAGAGGSQVSASLVVRDVNPDLLSPGRKAFVDQLLSDLVGGYIDSGVDPQTGEQR